MLDFAENYSFLVQDASPGFHWNKSQATIHPFVIHYVDGRGKLAHKSYACIYKWPQLRITQLRCTVFYFHGHYVSKEFPFLHKVLYFSDGSAAQYKKLKNLINLIVHQSNFHIHAEFFCHHGKNACDGVGGTIKRLAAHASLQYPFWNQILTPKQLSDFAEANWWYHLRFLWAL